MGDNEEYFNVMSRTARARFTRNTFNFPIDTVISLLHD